MIRPERGCFPRLHLDHVSLMVVGIELPDPDWFFQTVLDHVEWCEGDDLRQAGLAHVDIDTDAVAVDVTEILNNHSLYLMYDIY